MKNFKEPQIETLTKNYSFYVKIKENLENILDNNSDIDSEIIEKEINQINEQLDIITNRVAYILAYNK